MAVIFFWVLFAIVVGWLATQKGRSGIAFFLIALVFTPLLGLIAVLLVRPDYERLEQKALASGRLKKCPHCAEAVKREANVCKHCGKDLVAEENIIDAEIADGREKD